ncbi:DUF4386 domain-containing protein [Cognaticolwellia mytili]|uniref:DUF4386 domain-containing protein n=1 Tax=Cognaticolwellia mytili TaxID=1888913 RepID=UPI000A171BE4|nr:DUF4386 domain-containing protein [Cognaticolwellia mytili]
MSSLFAARMVGALFLISTSSYMVASSLIGELFSSPDYLELFYPNKYSVTTAVLLEFINSAAVVGIAIVIYPIVKQYNERIALGYVAFRLIEAVMLLIGAVALLSMMRLSKELVETTVNNVEHLHTMATVLRAERYYDFQMGMIPLAMCGFILCITFYQYRLVPRLLSGLGLLGYFALLLKILFDFFDVSLGGALLYIPGALFEFILPLWLIVKGFNLDEKPKQSETVE